MVAVGVKEELPLLIQLLIIMMVAIMMLMILSIMMTITTIAKSQLKTVRVCVELKPLFK